jgi:hypothetical protein
VVDWERPNVDFPGLAVVGSAAKLPVETMIGGVEGIGEPAGNSASSARTWNPPRTVGGPTVKTSLSISPGDD